MRIIYLLIVIIILSSCDKENVSISVKQCFPMNNDAELYAKALNNLAVPHSYNAEKKCIYGGSILSEKKSEYELVAFGTPPPPGLSTTYMNNNAPFINLLASNGVKTKVVKYKGVDYIVWGYADHQKAEELLKLEPWVKDSMKEARNESK